MKVGGISMNEHDKKKFRVNMALIKNCLDGIDNDKLRTENLIKTEVSVIRRLIKELEEMVEAEKVVNIRGEGTGMKEEYIHVFKRNMDTVNVTLEHVLYNSSIPRDIIKGNFELIRKVVDHCEELALDEIPVDEEKSLEHNTEQLRIGIVDESTKKAIENNVMFFNSGIRLLCNGGRISGDMIECEFSALQLLLDDCKRRLYNTIED